MFEWVGKLKDEELALVAKMGVSFRQWGGEGMKEKTVFKTIFELTQRDKNAKGKRQRIKNTTEKGTK